TNAPQRAFLPFKNLAPEWGLVFSEPAIRNGRAVFRGCGSPPLSRRFDRSQIAAPNRIARLFAFAVLQPMHQAGEALRKALRYDGFIGRAQRVAHARADLAIASDLFRFR